MEHTPLDMTNANAAMVRSYFKNRILIRLTLDQWQSFFRWMQENGEDISHEGEKEKGCDTVIIKRIG